MEVLINAKHFDGLFSYITSLNSNSALESIIILFTDKDTGVQRHEVTHK